MHTPRKAVKAINDSFDPFIGCKKKWIGLHGVSVGSCFLRNDLKVFGSGYLRVFLNVDLYPQKKNGFFESAARLKQRFTPPIPSLDPLWVPRPWSAAQDSKNSSRLVVVVVVVVVVVMVAIAVSSCTMKAVIHWVIAS